jgi:RecB family exonuclease
VRVPDLHTFRRAIAALSVDQVHGDARAGAVIVPTRGAARQVRLAIGHERTDILTREEMYERLGASVPESARRLTPIERDSIMQGAAARAAADVPGLSFRLRPGLVAEILRFYDQLRRQAQQVERFEELLEDMLGPAAAAGDRGAERMRLQTRFLARAFREYERRAAESGGDDEHALRGRLLEREVAAVFRHVIVTVADWVADPAGLFVADFDLLARLPGLERLDIVSTEATLASGFHERLRNWLPGLEEIEGAALTGSTSPIRPVLVSPPDPPDRLWFTHRDRGEELVAVARRIKTDRRRGRVVPLNRIAVVSKRPLPYLYLAPDTIGAAGIPCQASDTLPLAAEPTATAVDLMLEFVEAGFTRAAIVALLRTPHLDLGSAERPVSRESISALDRALSDARYLGDLRRLEAFAEGRAEDAATPALEAAVAAARTLVPLLDPAPASEQLRRFRTFTAAHARPLSEDDPFASREQRARAAIADTLDRLIAAHAAHHDPPWTVEPLAAAVRRWIGEQTFASEGPQTGIHLLDDQAARYSDFDEMTIVGLVEGEWPERAQRNVFYPPALLRSLGWPSEKDRRGAEDARFLDLAASASERVVLSTFTLDDESLATRSVQLDDVARARLTVLQDGGDDGTRIFADEALAADPPSLAALDSTVRGWAEMRMARPPSHLDGFHGYIGPQGPRAWSVSALETYLGCPFRFFAQHVLKLDEEPDDEEVMDPRQQGLLLHEVFERFFAAWQAAGHGRVSSQNLDAARALFVEVVDRALTSLPETEAGLARTRLLGSSAASGLGEAVLRMEAERPTGVVERLLEHRIDGDFEITTTAGARTIPVRGKVDRLDLLEDGTFRLIDYKLGWPPNRARALQLPIYGLCAEQRLARYRGRSWTLGEAAYLAFKGPRRVVPLVTSHADRARVLADAQERFAAVIDAVQRGEHPPSPDDVFRCETCSFSSVCRKDYVGDI